jgi:hypothetical protein
MVKMRTSQCSAPQRRQQAHARRGGIRSRHGRIRATAVPPHRNDRRTALARALQVWPHELDDDAGTRLQIVHKLRRTLRAERRRGIAGHWTYDLARHVELLRLYREEVSRLPAVDRAAIRRRRG